jgi:formylglycine-generating enzyme required for sulfatase activity
MKVSVRRWWVLIVIVGLAAVVYVLAGAVGGDAEKSGLYAAGETAVAAGRWSEALTRFSTLVALDPEYRDARKRLAEAKRQGVQQIPGSMDVNAEIELLRWLVASGDFELLAEALDRSAIRIPAGTFLMGNHTGRANERPQRLIYLDTFAMDRYEVTNVQYQRFLQVTGNQPPLYWLGNAYPPGQTNYPVVAVSWMDAEAYCAWAGKRLPTEAEWEKACRGTDGRVYPWGDTWDLNRANVGIPLKGAWPFAFEDAIPLLQATPVGTVIPGLRPVGSYLDGASPYGIMDLVGNASEWVWDWYNWSGYENVPERNPRGLGPPWNRCLRGSGWYEPYGSPDWGQESSRCSARNSSHSSNDPRAGFRCARNVP